MDEYFKDIEKQRIHMPNANESKDKPKKFVFQIYPENIDYIDSLSYEDKHYLINQLITNYRKYGYTENDSETEKQKYKTLIINIILFLLLIPVVLLVINVSLNVTHSNYQIYQGNFERLFNNR